MTKERGFSPESIARKEINFAMTHPFNQMSVKKLKSFSLGEIFNKTINREEYYREFMNAKNDPRYIFLDNLEHLRTYASILDDEGFVEEGFENVAAILEYERLHLEAAKKQGFTNPAIVLYFTIDDEDDLYLHHTMEVGKIPDTMTDKEYFQALRTILTTPKILTTNDQDLLKLLPYN